MSNVNKRLPTLALRLVVATSFLLLFGIPAATAQTVDDVTQQGEARVNDNAAAQQRVESAADAVADLEIEYKNLVKVVDGLKVYNELLNTQVNNQVAEMEYLDGAIDSVSLIERQIVPLMIDMIDKLELFIQADKPFLLGERNRRVNNLRTMMQRADVTAAEKFRRVIEAYQIEVEYGRTIETYKEVLAIDGRELEAQFLRVGRVALLFQSADGDLTGAWDVESNSYTEIPASQFRNQVRQGIRVAGQEIAPDLITIPVNAATRVSQ